MCKIHSGVGCWCVISLCLTLHRQVLTWVPTPRLLLNNKQLFSLGLNRYPNRRRMMELRIRRYWLSYVSSVTGREKSSEKQVSKRVEKERLEAERTREAVNQWREKKLRVENDWQQLQPVNSIRERLKEWTNWEWTTSKQERLEAEKRERMERQQAEQQRMERERMEREQQERQRLDQEAELKRRSTASLGTPERQGM